MSRCGRCSPEGSGEDQLQQVVRGQRAVEVVPLGLVAIGGKEEGALLVRFHPFRDDPLVQRVGQGGDRMDDGAIVGVRRDIADERLIDLELRDGELLQAINVTNPVPVMVPAAKPVSS